MGVVLNKFPYKGHMIEQRRVLGKLTYWIDNVDSTASILGRGDKSEWRASAHQIVDAIVESGYVPPKPPGRRAAKALVRMENRRLRLEPPAEHEIDHPINFPAIEGLLGPRLR